MKDAVPQVTFVVVIRAVRPVQRVVMECAVIRGSLVVMVNVVQITAVVIHAAMQVFPVVVIHAAVYFPLRATLHGHQIALVIYLKGGRPAVANVVMVVYSAVALR